MCIATQEYYEFPTFATIWEFVLFGVENRALLEQTIELAPAYFIRQLHCKAISSSTSSLSQYS